jgi:hypothetical protein
LPSRRHHGTAAIQADGGSAAGFTELFDVGVILNVRCPRGIGPSAPSLEEALRGENIG